MKLTAATPMQDETVHIGLNQKKRQEVAEKLAGFLASTYTLYQKSLYYHWNVTGIHFHSLHALFEEQYQELHQAGDAIAERIRALGHVAPGTYREFAKLSSVKEDDSLPESAEVMLKHMLEANEHCSVEAREVLKVAERNGDDVTADMMIARMNAHEKTAWMIRATLGQHGNM